MAISVSCIIAFPFKYQLEIIIIKTCHHFVRYSGVPYYHVGEQLQINIYSSTLIIILIILVLGFLFIAFYSQNITIYQNVLKREI